MIKLCKEIVIFLFFAKILENFGVSEKYGKFVKLILSLIVVLKLITPVFSLFGNKFHIDEMAKEMEKYFMIEEENYESLEAERADIEKVNIPDVHLKVEEIQWEK